MSTYSDGATEQAHVDARLDVAAIKAEALREAAAAWEANEGPGYPTARWLRDRADHLTEGGTDV